MLTPEQIAAEAAATDAAAAGTAPGAEASAPGGQGAPGAKPELTTAQELAGMFQMALDIAERKGKFPTLRGVWGPAEVAVFCESLGAVLDKYDLSPGWFFKQFGLEIMAAFSCLPLLFASIKALKLDIERERAAAEKDVTPGAAGSAPL